MSHLISAAKHTAKLLLSALIAWSIGVGSAAAQRAQQAAPTRVSIPDDAKLTLLIQTHIAALSHANLTGNYSVLHALGSPAFQNVNSPAQLAANFAVFRSQAIDISPAILLPPLLFGPPKLEGADLLRVSGQYDTKPQRVLFEMAFQVVNNAWRLAGIAASTVAADQAGAQAADQTPKAARPSSVPKR